MNNPLFWYALSVGGAAGGVAYSRYHKMDAIDTAANGAISGVAVPFIVIASPVWLPAWAIGETAAKIYTKAKSTSN